MADPGNSQPDGGFNNPYPYATDPGHFHHYNLSHASDDTVARSNANTQIVKIWSDRLSLTSVLASFFTSIDSLLFSLSVSQENSSHLGKIMTSAFAGALVFHVSGAIVAFTASFVLIRFKLADLRAHTPPTTVVHSAPATFNAPPPRQHGASTPAANGTTTRPPAHASGRTHTQHSVHSAHSAHSPAHRRPSSHAKHARSSSNVSLTVPASAPAPGPAPAPARPPSPFSSAALLNLVPHLDPTDILAQTSSFFTHLLKQNLPTSSAIRVELVHPFRRSKPRRKAQRGLERGLPGADGKRGAEPADSDSDDDDDPEKDIGALERLLMRAHRACALFVLLGFTALILGVVAFAWAVLERPVSIFTSVCVGFSLALAFLSLH